jgi:hypothetical protein
MVFSVWGRHVSGPIFAVLSIGLAFAYAHYANNSTATTWLLKWAAYVSGVISAFLIFIAQYQVWKAEHDKYETEVHKNEKPEIRGAAFLFHTRGGTRTETAARHGMDKMATFPIAFIMNVCNYRNVKTNLVEIRVDGSRLTPPVDFVDIRSDLLGKVLDYGIAQFNVAVYASAQVHGHVLADLKTIPLDNLSVSVYDGFIESHAIIVQQGENLTL